MYLRCETSGRGEVERHGVHSDVQSERIALGICTSLIASDLYPPL